MFALNEELLLISLFLCIVTIKVFNSICPCTFFFKVFWTLMALWHQDQAPLNYLYSVCTNVGAAGKRVKQGLSTLINRRGC